jgi:membrane protein implicated in regulation of membrane protease activity
MVAAKKSSKKHIHHSIHKHKEHKVTKDHSNQNKGLIVSFFCFIVSLALSIVGFLKNNWQQVFIGLGLLVLTLILNILHNHKKAKKQEKQKSEPIKHENRIDKLVEKEIFLDRIKVRRKITFFFALFLFSLVPMYIGYTSTQWLTLALGAVLAILTIIGLFMNLGKLKHAKKDAKIESKQPKVEKSKKAVFILIVVLIVALINVVIFFVPKSWWLYIGLVLVVGIVVAVIIRLEHKKDGKHPQQEETHHEEKVVEVVDDDIKKVLKITDELLGNLPDEVINKFAKSQDFELYERVLNKYKVK